MNAHKPRYGRKQVCPCPLAKKKFSPQLDQYGRPNGRGKCWSPSCRQKFNGTSTAPEQTRLTPPQTGEVRHHVYHTADGTRHMQITVIKAEDGSKRAFAERWDGISWQKGVDGIERLPYRLPDVIERISLGGIIVICEGEKDCDRAFEIGVTATTCPFGSGKWLDSMSLMLTGARVVIVPDLDEPGWEHSRMVERSLLDAGVGALGILDLRTLKPDLPVKSDLSDYLDRGGDPEALRQAIEVAVREVEVHDVTLPVLPTSKIDWRTLPKPLLDLVGPIDDERQRVALLMAAITVIGAVVPGVRTLYYGQHYGPALYLFVYGPPGSGKGTVTPAEHLIQTIDQELREETKEAFTSYEGEYAYWKAKGAKAGEPPPEKPIRKARRLSADGTGSVIVRATRNNPAPWCSTQRATRSRWHCARTPSMRAVPCEKRGTMNVSIRSE